MKRFLVLMAAAACCGTAFGEVFATVGSPLGTVTVSSNQVGEVTEGTDGTLRWTGSMTNTELGWGLDWDFEVNGDPFITGVAGFTNLMGAAADFSFDLSTASTATIAAPTVSGASTITVLDVNADGATMAALGGDSIYRAFIEATTEQTLFADPYSLVAPAGGVNFDGTTWGPQAGSVGITIGDMFGIDHDFNLSAGDQATLNSSFFIVPEPATLSLLVLGGLLATRRR